MSNLFQFSNRSDLDSIQNLDLFIRKCKEELTVFGADIDWSAWIWPKVANFTKLGSSSRSHSVDDRMGEPFISFAKAYFRYQQGHNPTGTKNETKALKVLEFVLSERSPSPDISELDITLLDRAAIVAREHYSGAAYQCGRELERLAKFVTTHKLVSHSCGDWRNPIARPTEGGKRTGKSGREERDKKLPHPDAVLAMADIFANCGDIPRDIFTSSVFALLMSGSVRISEVLTLPLACQHSDHDKDGNPVFGLRFYSGKGFGWNIKWVPTVMVEVVKTAIDRITKLTEEGRSLAEWLEQHPDTMFIHPDYVSQYGGKSLSEIDACEALGLNLSHSEACQRMYYSYGFRRGDSITLESLWDKIKSRVPDEFPWVNKDAGIKYSGALFAMQANSLHAQRGTLRVLPWMPDVNIINNDLSPRESLGEGANHSSIFKRYGYKHLDGTEMKITTHQMRHMIDTMGHRGGMSEDEIARFAGRADPKQNRVYNHITSSEVADRYERLQAESAHGKAILVHCEPVDREAYNLAPKGAIHKSKWGWCTHDFSSSPCGMFRDCLNCNEHLCEKRTANRAQLEQDLREIEEQLAEAELAMAAGYAGADRWYEHHALSAVRLRELVGIFRDDAVEEGALIRIKNDFAPSHATRAIATNHGDVSGRLDDESSKTLSNLIEFM
ncbi:integrase [Pseudomonas amygdali]|uniref:integrase n=1 Tax=Pseudomonas amygdali TaxID=47877 RepID=UPI001FB58A89|nr:integrase [Pseudomonas amygdali]UPT37857.1 integrase [Pseudomonas amygdali pv. loropetali]